jgi:hypothetical protein
MHSEQTEGQKTAEWAETPGHAQALRSCFTHCTLKPATALETEEEGLKVKLHKDLTTCVRLHTL